MKIIKVKCKDGYSSIRSRLRSDVEDFIDEIDRGAQWILKGEILSQFYDFTGDKWLDSMFNKKVVDKIIMDDVMHNSQIEIYNTIQEAEKAGFEI